VPSLLLVNIIYIIYRIVFSLLVFGPLCRRRRRRRIGAIVAACCYRIVPLSVCVVDSVVVCFGLLLRTVTRALTTREPQPRSSKIQDEFRTRVLYRRDGNRPPRYNIIILLEV